ncbi:MAG: hypothetical protein ACE5JV_02740 [Nitrososphaerales archaeon]
MIFRKKERERCALCGVEMQHKHRPMREWGIDGSLCGDCYLDMMRDYYVEKKTPKKRVAKCDQCGREVDPEDLYEAHRGLNLKGRLCKDCFEGKKTEVEKKLDYCTVCGKKLGFFRYNPRKKWNMDGQLCRECWDVQNARG